MFKSFSYSNLLSYLPLYSWALVLVFSLWYISEVKDNLTKKNFNRNGKFTQVECVSSASPKKDKFFLAHKLHCELQLN